MVEGKTVFELEPRTFLNIAAARNALEDNWKTPPTHPSTIPSRPFGYKLSRATTIVCVFILLLIMSNNI